MQTQYYVLTNDYSHDGQWKIFADETTVVGSYSDPDDVRGHLLELGYSPDDTVAIDGDGNGSIVHVPIGWIGDGEKLVMSKRVIDLIA